MVRKFGGAAAFLGLILATAALLRSFLNDSETPDHAFARHDEIHYVSNVVRFARGYWHVASFINPTFQSYLLYAATRIAGSAGVLIGRYDSLDHFALAITLDPYLVRMVGRVLAAAFGVLSVLLLFLVARRVVSTPAALVAAAALAVDRTHALRCVIAGNESTMVLLVLATFLAILRYHERPSVARHLACGLLLGLASATKYNAFVVVAPLGFASAAAWIGAPDRMRPRRILASSIGFVAAPLAFVATSPYVLVNAKQFVTDFAKQSSFLHAGYVANDATVGARGWSYYVTAFGEENAGVAFAVLCGAGAVLAFVRAVTGRDGKAALVLLAAVPCYLFLGSGIFSRMRFLLPAIPFMLLLGAYAIDRAAARITVRPGRHAWIVGVVGAATLLPALAENTGFIRRQVGDRERRQDLRDWAHAHLDPREVYLELASAPPARVLDREEEIRAFRIERERLRSDAERRALDDHLAGSIRSMPLQIVMDGATTLAELLDRMEQGGYRHLVLVLVERHRKDFDRLPAFVNERGITGCPFWPELVRLLDSLESSPTVTSHDGTLTMRVLTLPWG